jgi:glycosyltransferase involved in cell wall biosynthesis
MRINWFSPLPPARTDIAHYTARILPALRARAEVVLWTNQSEWQPSLEDQAEVRRFDPGSLPWSLLDPAEATFFQIGNSSPFHRAIWQVCQEYPGIAVLHDVLLHDAVVNHCRISPEVEGAYPDGWTGERLSVAFPPGGERWGTLRARRLTVRLRPPEWLPDGLSVRVLPDVDGRPDIRVIPPGGRLEIVRDLPSTAGRIELHFPPSRHAGGLDSRILGARLEATAIAGPGGQVRLNGRENYLETMESLYGPRGRRDAELHWRGVLSLDQMAGVYSCIPFMLPASRAVVVHSRMAERAVRRESRLPVVRLELPAPLAIGPQPAETELLTVADQFVPSTSAPAPPWRLVVFGYLGPNRGLDSILEALRLLEERGLFHLHILGALHDPGAVLGRIERLGLQELVTVHGPATEAKLEAALEGAHLALNLRYPTRGEASGAQLRIWRHALPSIVTRIGWYAEQPPDTVAFVRPGSMVEDLCAQLRSYAAEPERFVRMGLAGYRHFAAHHAPERYVAGLMDLAARVRGGR